MRSKLLVLISLFLLLVSCTPTYIVTFSGSIGGSVSNPGGEYDEGTIVSVSAQPDTGYEFTRWSDGSTQNPRTISISENLNLTALFSKQQFSVSVNTQGEGTVATSGATGQGSFEYGSSARFEAVPAAGWEFDSWSGDASGSSNPLTISIDGPKSITAIFKRKKFDLSITIQGEGTVTEQVIVQPGQYDYETQVKLTAVPEEGWEFASWSGDIGSTENPVNVTVSTAKNITANFEKLEIVSIEILNPISSLIVSKYYTPKVMANLSNGESLEITHSVEISKQNQNVTILNSSIIGASKGNEVIEFKYDNYVTTLGIEVSNVEFESLDDRFSQDQPSIIKVPFVMINLFPTTDGIVHNDTIGPSSYWNIQNPDLSLSKQKIKNLLIVSKNAIELGSSFRDYGTNSAEQYIQLKPEAYINVYVNQNITYRTKELWNGTKTLDYEELFEDLNIQDFVENKGVKEIWITEFPYGEYPSLVDSGLYNQQFNNWLPESNMSSPLTGDISNSYRIRDDLPIYSSTYIVYGNSGHRGVDTNLHNRGHQIEAMLSYLEKDKLPNQELFWNKFVGIRPSTNGNIDWSKQALNGRAGNTHFPPNATSDYDYNNQDYIESDIRNWLPEGGTVESLNSSLWKNLDLNFTYNKYSDIGIGNINNDAHTKWLIFWFQSIPGYQNNIPYEKDGVEYTLTNWWDLIYNWDEAVTQGKTLWE